MVASPLEFGLAKQKFRKLFEFFQYKRRFYPSGVKKQVQNWLFLEMSKYLSKWLDEESREKNKENKRAFKRHRDWLQQNVFLFTEDFPCKQPLDCRYVCTV